MEQIMLVNKMIRYIETRIKSKISYEDMEKMFGLSYRQLRENFVSATHISLKKYITARKVANIAYDTFTRSFKRETGITPKEFRKKKAISVKRELIAMETYAPVLPQTRPVLAEESLDSNSSAVLFGVPQVAFVTGKCSPFPACMESLLSYIGQKEYSSYAWLSGASGTAFRLCWKEGGWDMKNSALSNVYESFREYYLNGIAYGEEKLLTKLVLPLR